MPEIIIPDTIETAMTTFTGDAPRIRMSGLAIGIGIEFRLVIVPMTTIVAMGTILGGTTVDTTGVGNLFKAILD